MSTAFELTEVDVFAVMRNHGMKPTENEVAEALESLSPDEVEAAALAAEMVDDDDGLTLNAQTAAAYEHIAQQLKRSGKIPLTEGELRSLQTDILEDIASRAEKFDFTPDENSLPSAVEDSAAVLGYTGLPISFVQTVSQAYLDAREAENAYQLNNSACP